MSPDQHRNVAMRSYTLMLATLHVFVLSVLMSDESLAQNANGASETSGTHRILTVRRHRSADGVTRMDDCGTADSCRSNLQAADDVDADASDPFSTCISGCDIDVIFRALSGRPSEGWKR